jgi:predicted DNA-binding transcriptional regulator AlpA
MKEAGAFPITPRILRRELAALYVGLGATTWDAEVSAGRAPRPVNVTPGVKGWDRHDLDLWIEERKAAQAPALNPWDEP